MVGVADGHAADGTLRIVSRDDDVTLRPTTPEDFGILRTLFDDASFAGWGGTGRASDEMIREKYLGGRLPGVECFLVLVDPDPVGLAQLHSDGEQAGGMDLIVLPRARGCGVGRAAVENLVHRARSVHGWASITVDPDVENRKGIRFWGAVGFDPVRVVEDEPGQEPYLLMERRDTGGGDA